MADQHIDIERMVMQAHYKMQLEAEASSVKGGKLSDMEREQYQNQIKDLLQAVETLLKSNKAMGEKLDKATAAYEDLKAENAKLKGELAMRKRAQYGKGSEKPKDSSESKSASDGSKNEDEEKYIEDGSKNDVPPADDDVEESGDSVLSVEPQEKKARDTSNRPEHYKTMSADICVVHDCDLEKAESPITGFKAVKNAVELANIRSCYMRDSVQLCRFIKWVVERVRATDEAPITESEAAAYLDHLRTEISDYMDLSFGTISAYGPNAAMMHYEAVPGVSDAVLKPEGMLLVDSGGQYLTGTTDVTRTIALGPVTDEMKKHYTLTAVSNLQLMGAVFMHGCTGINLDILAREPMWKEGLDYKCGTGHGIGYYLGVHESPPSIRWKVFPGRKDTPFEPGMIVSDEPGVYLEGKYGIRIETILEVVEHEENESGRFLAFEPLTLVPFDRNLIDPNWLTPYTRKLLNEYHERVCAQLMPFMTAQEQEWLLYQTAPI